MKDAMGGNVLAHDQQQPQLRGAAKRLREVSEEQVSILESLHLLVD